MKIENIKFKAKNTLDGKWIKGDLVHHKDSDNVWITDYENQLTSPVNPSTVCQFTGLKDCNGNEIWEGDIILDTIYGRLYTVMRSGYGAFFIRKNKSVNDDMYLFELIEEERTVQLYVVPRADGDRGKRLRVLILRGGAFGHEVVERLEEGDGDEIERLHIRLGVDSGVAEGEREILDGGESEHIRRHELVVGAVLLSVHSFGNVLDIVVGGV